MSRDPEGSLYALQSVLREITRAVRDLEGDAHWTGVLERLSRTAESLDPRNFEEREKFAGEVLDLFGGMGSFNDVSYSPETDALHTRLFERAEEETRCCWRALGRPWHEVPEDEVFALGDRVRIVAGEVIRIDHHRQVSRAPNSPLTYRVVDRISNDRDNMPRYGIEAGSRGRWARHNALRPAGDRRGSGR